MEYHFFFSRQQRYSCIACFAGLLLLFLSVEAWVSFPPRSRYSNSYSYSYSYSYSSSNTGLFYSSDFGDDNYYDSNNSTSTSSSPVLERLRINGVSVSPKGFHVLLEPTTARARASSNGNGSVSQAVETEAPAPAPAAAAAAKAKAKQEETKSKDDDESSVLPKPHEETTTPPAAAAAARKKEAHTNTNTNTNINTNTASTRKNENTNANIVLPLKMTNDPADAYAATSPESLTLCQLLSGVDMAGAILPPELLGKIVVSHIEDKLESLYEDEDEDEDDDDEDDDSSSSGAAAVFEPVLSPIEGKLWEYLKNQEALSREHQAFAALQSTSTSASPATPFRIQMPRITLDQLTLVPAAPSRSNRNISSRNSDASPSQSPVAWLCRLECALPEWKDRIRVDVKADLLASLAYNYDPESSPLFTCIALALRYKAPIVLEQKQQHQQQEREQRQDSLVSENNNGENEITIHQINDNRDHDHDHHHDTDEPPKSNNGNGNGNGNSNSNHNYWSSRDDLDRDFPHRTTIQSLQQQSSRVTENIERGFEIHKLMGALQIAKRLGDTKAAEKIRAKLDEYDSMDDLPTLGDNNNNNNIDDNKDHGDHPDDLGENIFQ